MYIDNIKTVREKNPKIAVNTKEESLSGNNLLNLPIPDLNQSSCTYISPPSCLRFHFLPPKNLVR